MDSRDENQPDNTNLSDNEWWVFRAWRGRRRWLFLAGLIVATLLLPQLVIVVALVFLITAIVAVARGNRTWLRIPTRKMAFAVSGGALALMLVASSVNAAGTNLFDNDAVTASLPQVAAEDEKTPSPKPSASRTRTASPTPTRTVKEEAVTEVIPFESSTVEDGSLPVGETVVTPGVDGQKTLTYKVTYEGNKEVSRELITEEITVAPVPQVTTNGTYVAPPPPPPPAAPANGCDPNYADACVPRSSDVDCAWGSGNGPAYFDGVARVIGSDIYGLDRDGDGYACERD